MKALVIGSGGREHAIAWRLNQSPSIREVIVAGQNPGCARIAQCITPHANTPEGYLTIAREKAVDLTVVGPEAPLVDGVVDAFEAAGLAVFGPTQAAAQLEGSKIFSKDFMARHGIPTARYQSSTTAPEAKWSLDAFRYPVVVKADGLAAGKGVIICEDRASAEQTIDAMFAGTLVGAAGARVVVEEFLTGEEVSFIALCDGEGVLRLEPSQDHKTIFENDKGPNTGGMGAYSDSRILSAPDREYVMRYVMQATIDGMKKEGHPFRGFLYAGLMMTKDGPMVLEFNVRLGDPETQALLHRMTGDFGALLHAACRGKLDPAHLSFREDPSVCVVMAAHGYPGKVRSGDLISGIESAEQTGAVVFQAGTRQGASGVETSGGRVLGVTAGGPTLQAAITNVYAAVDKIRFDGAQIRRDIGRKGLARW